MNTVWKNDNEFGIYNLTEDNGNVVCRLRPKHTLKYIDYVGKLVWEDEKKYIEWFYKSNYFYRDISPYEMKLEEVFDMLMRIEYSVYI